MTTLAQVFLEGDSFTAEQSKRILADSRVLALQVAIRAAAVATHAPSLGQDLDRSLVKALQKPVTDMVLGAWTTWKELHEFADSAKHPDEEQNTYSLGEHSITSTYEPHIEVRLNGQVLADIPVEVKLELELEFGELLIRAGRIWELRLGKASGVGTLSVGKTQIAQIPSKPIPFPGVIHFESGIPIPR